MSEITLDPGISASMEALGIDQSSLDADEITNVETESMEADVKTAESSEDDAIEEEADASEASDAAEVKAQGEEGKEAPIEAPAEAAKETETEATKLEYAEKERALTERTVKFEAEMKELKEKFQEKLRTHDEFDAFFIDLEAKDPDLYGLVKSAFHEHTRQYNNPVVAELKKSQEALRAELDSFKSAANAEVTLSKLDGDRKSLVNGLGKEAELAGIKFDMQKVEATWAKNPGLSLEQAAWVEYGPALMKASASKAKVEAVEKKVAARPAVKTAGAVKSSNTQVHANVPSDPFKAVHYFAKQFRG